MTEPTPVSPPTIEAPAASSAVDNEDARSIAGSEKSTASSRSGIPKYGGSKLPTAARTSSVAAPAATPITSKIGRPCAGQTKAPLPPVTPPKIGSTGSSMDALWDLHPRRLSEAGLSRYSDNSTVLTEDTNSFIIGQRVFVGGTKPGQIAYIGETQFAPGEWAGIVLDQPIGKNDGSVGGIRYFQCEPKRGVFSRLTRLTRYPLGPDAAGGDTYCASPSPTNGVRRSPMSPTTSTRSALSISNTSLASAHVDFKVGDRVIIKSSQGSKVGTLRYMGFTSFANGEWCGVELDEPRGKNDGSVSGERYFDCRPNYGLFAPVSKVSKSPSNRKPGNCVVHSSMRRSNSKESLLSLNSSLASASVASTAAARRVRLGVTSLTPKKSQTPPKGASTPLPSRTALQDVLKEKQQHIEQLMKELDLERAETTKAAGLADEAEQKYVLLQKDFENFRVDCDRKFKEYSSKLVQVESENKELLGQLDEEKQKNEDWQFKFEETKAVDESTNEEHVAKIAQLETQIDQLQKQVNLETQNSSTLKEDLLKLQEENESIKVELEHAVEKRSTLENEESKSIELVQTLQAQLEDANSALKEHQEISLKQIEELNKQITKLNSEHEVTAFKLNKEIEELRAKYSTDINIKNDELKTLTVNYEETRTVLEDTKRDYEKYKYDTNLAEQTLRKELDKIKMEMSAKILELETQHELVKSQASDMKKLEEVLAKTQQNLESQIKETENVNMEEEKSIMELTKLKQLLEESAAANNKLKEDLQTQLENNKKQIESSNLQCLQVSEELNITKVELQKKIDEVENLCNKLKANEDELIKSCQNVEKGKTEFEQLQQRLQTELNNIQQEKVKEADLELKLGDAQRNAQQLEEKLIEAMKVKEKMEGEIQQLIGSSGEESSKLEILNRELQNKQAEFEVSKNQFDEKIKELEHALQEAHIKIANNQENFILQKSDLEATIVQMQTQSKESSDADINTINNLNKTIAQLRNDLEIGKLNIMEHEKTIESYKQELDKEVKTKFEIETTLGENSRIAKELQLKLDEASNEIQKLRHEAELSKEELQNLMQSLQIQSSESQNAVILLQKQIEEEQASNKSALADKEATVKELLGRIEEIEKHASTKDALSAEKDLEISQLKQVNIEIKKHSEELRIDGDNNKQLLDNLQAEFSKLNAKNQEITSKLQEKDHELQEALKIESTLLEKNNKIASLESKLDEVHKSIESITLQLQTSKNNEMKIQKELEDKLEHTKKLEAVLLSKEQEDKDVNYNLLSKNEEIAKLQEQLQIVSSSREELNQCNTNLQTQVAQLQQIHATNLGEMDNYQKQHLLYDKLLKVLKITEEHMKELLNTKEICADESLKKIIAELQTQNVHDNKDKIFDLEQTINMYNEKLQEANKRISEQQTEITVFQEALKSKEDNGKKVTNVQMSDETMNNNNTLNSIAYKQLLEEKLQAEGEIQFLQSIIADMQRKHEEQKSRIEILESGYSPAAADELKLIGFSEKKIAPRLYCDICEEFDLHETEDCPTQADDDMPPPPDRKKVKPPPRPYCEICEVFGHDTNDCPEEETY